MTVTKEMEIDAPQNWEADDHPYKYTAARPLEYTTLVDWRSDSDGADTNSAYSLRYRETTVDSEPELMGLAARAVTLSRFRRKTVVPCFAACLLAILLGVLLLPPRLGFLVCFAGALLAYECIIVLRWSYKRLERE